VLYMLSTRTAIVNKESCKNFVDTDHDLDCHQNLLTDSAQATNFVKIHS